MPRNLTFMLIVAGVIGLTATGMVLWHSNDHRMDKRGWRDLIEIAGPAKLLFDPAMIADLPDPAQRYFRYTISPGAPLYTFAEIDMGGELGLGAKDNPNYAPMRAHRILAPPHGLVWRIRSGAISGSDGATPHSSWTRFWLFGVVPIVRAGATPDHHRSAFGRVVSEGAFWVPASLLPGETVRWEAVDDATARAIVTYAEFEQAVDITVAEDGRPTKVVIQRWSNANADKEFRLQPFGGFLSAFREFNGYRLPTHVEGGNMIDSDEYFPFYKAKVTDIRMGGAPDAL